MKLFLYVLILSFLFGVLDWQSVHLTRWAYPDWLEWMHGHEKQYALITRPIEFVLCTPCMALKPIFYDAAMNVGASQEEQDAVTHAPRLDWNGFYHLVDRRTSWTFVPWFWWFVYWLPPSLLWWRVARRWAR